MTRFRLIPLCGLAVWVLSAMLLADAAAAQPVTLWQIGKADQANAEFALAPNQHAKFAQDGFFVPGKSNPATDWPYVHPGPVDAWAGGRAHTFTVLFGVKGQTAGSCTLRVHLLDSHSLAPPELSISLNGQEKRHRPPQGGGDDSINGKPEQGKRHSFDVVFSPDALKPGLNELGITTRSGSWILYDALEFQAPAGAELAEVSGTVISSAIAPPVLLGKEGSLTQPVRVTVRHVGEPMQAVLKMQNATPREVKLNTGSQEVELTIPAVEKETEAQVSLEVPSQPAITRSVAVKPVRKWVVYLLPHSHVDIGYTHVQTDVEKAQWRYIDLAMETSRKSASYPAGSRFKWNTEVLWAVDSYLRQASPEKQQAFFEAVKAGWIGLDALYGNELTGLCRAEELLRLVSLAAKLGARSGVPVTSAMITDVPGYTWGMVPTFAHGGVRYFSIGPNGGDRIGHTVAAWGDKPFWWIGPNGKDKVLVWMTGTGYYQVFQSAQRLQEYLTSLEAKGYAYDYVQVRHCLGDNGAPDVNFPDRIREWNEKHAYPKLVIATTAEMFRDFEARYADKLPVAKGDFTPYWEDGAASSARETALNRASADRLTQAETLFAMLGPDRYKAEDFYQAWRNVILYDEHTWGAHNSISQPDEPFVKSQWAIKQQFATDADVQSRELFNAAVRQKGGATDAIAAMDVLNTTGAGRTDLVQVPASTRLAGDVVKDPSGRVAPSQRLSSGELIFIASDVPAFGARRFTFGSGTPESGSARADAAGLQSPAIALQLDPKSGAIVSFKSKAVSGDLVDAKANSAINDYFYLPGTDIKGVQRSGEARIAVKEKGPLLASVVVESAAPGCKRLLREIRLVDGLDRVEIINTVDKLPIRKKEGVHFGFGFNVPDGQLRMDVPWAVVRPELDQIPGACKNWFTVQRWVDISNSRNGVTWVTVDAPLMEIGGLTANLVGSLSDTRHWLDRIEPSQTIYSWVMNNHWHTNYRAEQEGPTVFRYFLWPHGKFEQEATTRFAVSCSQPLVAVPAETGAKSLAPMVKVEPAGVVVSALKPSDDGKAMILRLYGASGKAERAKVSWQGQPARKVFYSDTTEQARSPVSGAIEVAPYGIVTLRAEL